MFCRFQPPQLLLTSQKSHHHFISNAHKNIIILAEYLYACNLYLHFTFSYDLLFGPYTIALILVCTYILLVMLH